MPIERRSAVLLGAGASRDAGLPLTSELAAGVLQHLSSVKESNGRPPDWLLALNFVYGAMISHRSRDGGNALAAVNIETLISALRLLGRRDDHEVAPFVERWRDPVLPAGQLRVDDFNVRRFSEALAAATSQDQDRLPRRRGSQQDHGLNLAYAVAAIADSARNPTRLGSYRSADEWVTRTLGKLLQPTKSVSYLFPLAELAERQPGGLDIITLNYDLTVERAMADKKVEVDRGLQDWPFQRVAFAKDAAVRLHKVHGSLDWAMEQDHQRGVPVLKDLDGVVAEQPWVVVGDREKLATDGPTLELMQQAADSLESADHLVISGYGFGDDHINQMLRNWLERDPERSVGLVEPNWSYSDQRTFRGRLSELYGERRYHDDGSRQSSRLQGFMGTAAELLGDALAVPEVDRSREVSIEIVKQAPSRWELEVSVRLRGTPLHQVMFSADRAECTVHVDAGRMDGRFGPIQYLDRWDVDEEIRVTVRTSSLPREEWQLHVDGQSLVSRIRRSAPLAPLSDGGHR